MLRDTATSLEKQVVQIDLVNVANRDVQVRDKTGAKFSAAFRETSAAFQIPQQGEFWTIIRSGWQWVLDARWDNDDEHKKLAEMAPGDGRINIPGSLNMQVGSANVNGIPFGGMHRDYFRSVQSQAAYSLSGTPVSDATIQVFKGSSFKHYGIDYTVSGKTLTFLTGVADAATDVTVYYQRIEPVYVDAAVVEGNADILIADGVTETHQMLDAGTATGKAYTWPYVAFGQAAIEAIEEFNRPTIDTGTVTGLAEPDGPDSYVAA